LFLGLCGCGGIALLYNLFDSAFNGTGMDRYMSQLILTFIGLILTLLLVVKAVSTLNGEKK